MSRLEGGTRLEGATIYLDETRTVLFKRNEDGEIVFSTNEGCTLNPNEVVAVTIFSETLRCLSQGKPLDLHFKPLDNPADYTTIYLCQWTRSGKLTVKSDNYSKRYQHANNVNEAIARKRTFTCCRAVFSQLPPRKG